MTKSHQRFLHFYFVFFMIDSNDSSKDIIIAELLLVERDAKEMFNQIVDFIYLIEHHKQFIHVILYD